MASKNKKFVDDGWAVWIEGEDVSTVYINDWINPKGKSYVDFAIRIKGINESQGLNIYIPFDVEKDEIIDISHHLKDEDIFRITFNSAGIIDYMKNEYTSEAAYNGKTIDIIHYPISLWDVSKLSKGTLLKFDLENIKKYLANDEGYIFIRLPHKTMDQIFKPNRNVSTFMDRLRTLITSPVVSENYVYQIRVNEARMLPQEINKIGSFHRQKLNKIVISLAISEDFEVNDHNCFKIRRLEEELYENFCPKNFKLDNTINYLWQDDRGNNYQGRFNFYLHMHKNKISHASMFIYMVLLILVGVLGEAIWVLIEYLFKLI